MTKPARANRMFKRVLLLIGTLCLFFLAAELVTRIVMPNSVKLRAMHQPDEKLGFKLVPNYFMEYESSEYSTIIKINAKGFRDREYKVAKESSVYRIIMLGDSQIFGLGVDLKESYPKVLETILNENNDRGIISQYEVVNAGVDGYGTEQEYMYLKELGAIYKPDLVIVGLTVNDIEDVMKGIPSAFSRNWLKKHFFFLSYMKGLHVKYKTRVKKYSKKLPRRFFQIYQDGYPPSYEKALQDTKDYLLRINRYARSIDSELLVVIIPQNFELGLSEWKKRGLDFLYTEEFFNNNMNRFSRIFTDFLREERVHVLPLLLKFRESGINPLYFSHDPHWTKDGHQLAAEVTYDYLKEKGFI
jgi:lysophospholipase L1-like esterase